MNLRQVQNKARSLMNKHGLTDWYFLFNNAKKSAGICDEGKRTIYLSRYLSVAMSEEKVTDTVLHEIAHALAGCHNGHNKVWKRECIRIGANPKRCYQSSEVDYSLMPQSKYTLICESCGQQTPKHRKVTRRISCGVCAPYRFNPDYLLTLKQNY